jgi:tetratricopeptide (TPR) repeat protein
MPKLRLDSWKSIAEYLERSPRTVQRWHAHNGLPVHHFGGCKGSVFAYAQEIDRWMITLAEETPGADADGDEAFEARKKRSQELTARAREMWETHSEESLATIAGLYRKAIDQNPCNAEALLGLADAMIASALKGVVDSSVAYPSATEALRRAEQLEANGLDVLCSKSWLNIVYERKWRQARAGFEEILSKQPQGSFSLSGLALLHIADGNLTSASNSAWEAWMQNTLVSSLGAMVCWIKYLQGDYELALELVAQVRGSGGSGATIAAVEALALNQAGPDEEAIQRIEELRLEHPQNQTLLGALGYAYAASKQTGKALEVLEDLSQAHIKKKPNNAYARALVFMGMGSGRDAIPCLEVSFDEGSLWSLGFRADPAMRRLRGEARFDLLLQKIGTPAVKGAQPGRSVAFMVRTASSELEREAVRKLARA